MEGSDVKKNNWFRWLSGGAKDDAEAKLIGVRQQTDQNERSAASTRERADQAVQKLDDRRR